MVHLFGKVETYCIGIETYRGLSCSLFCYVFELLLIHRDMYAYLVRSRKYALFTQM